MPNYARAGDPSLNISNRGLVAMIFYVESKKSVTFAPIPALAYARELCLSHSETRCPIWTIQIARDLVMSIRPRPADMDQVVRFECVGALTDQKGVDATAIMLTGARYEIDGKLEWWRREFWIVGYADDADRRWHINPRGCFHARKSTLGDVAKLDKRIEATFSGRFFDGLTPGHMLGDSCLVCGRPLSDPISRARRIGPECAGTSSSITTVPFLLAKRPAP